MTTTATACYNVTRKLYTIDHSIHKWHICMFFLTAFIPTKLLGASVIYNIAILVTPTQWCNGEQHKIRRLFFGFVALPLCLFSTSTIHLLNMLTPSFPHIVHVLTYPLTRIAAQLRVVHKFK